MPLKSFFTFCAWGSTLASTAARFASSALRSASICAGTSALAFFSDVISFCFLFFSALMSSTSCVSLRQASSSAMTLSTRPTSAKRRRCDSRTFSGSPPR